MTVSRREQILAAVKSKLDADGGVGGSTFRSRQAALSRNDGTAVVIEPLLDQSTQMAIPMLDWRLSLAITVIARGDIPDQIADPVVAEIHRRMMADLTLGGLAYDVQPQSSSWEFVSADKDAALVTMSFDMLYRTALEDISVS